VDELVAQATDPFRMTVGPPHRHGDADFLVFCGSLRCEGNGAHPLFRLLPAALHAGDSTQRPVQRALVQCLQAMHGKPQDFEAAQIIYLMQEWFVEAVAKVIHRQPRGMGWLSGLADTRLSRALTAIHERPGEAWTTDWLADLAGISRSRFAKLFTETIGESPLLYLNRWRVEQGCKLLIAGSAVTKVAHAMGFANASVFSRVFRRYHGKSPLEWLRSCQSSNVA
jgi:AraC-like DNA-binding protein